jgi:acetolactate synthase-1/2/3 large subunit
LARAYGIPGYTLRTEEDLVQTLPMILAAPGPAIVNCLTPADENVTPMVMAGKGIHEAIEC